MPNQVGSDRKILSHTCASPALNELTHLEGIDLPVQHLKRHSTLSMVNAPPDVAQRFVHCWTQFTGQPHTPEMTLCAYRLE